MLLENDMPQLIALWSHRFLNIRWVVQSANEVSVELRPASILRNLDDLSFEVMRSAHPSLTLKGEFFTFQLYFVAVRLLFLFPSANLLWTWCPPASFPNNHTQDIAAGVESFHILLRIKGSCCTEVSFWDILSSCGPPFIGGPLVWVCSRIKADTRQKVCGHTNLGDL